MRIAIVVALVLASSPALAQPGATPPSELPPDESSGAVDVQANANASINIDDLVARAQAASPTIETIARGTFRRARRAISIGPTIGGWAGIVPAQDETESAITFGIGVETFKVPVLPDPETLKLLVIERAKAKLKEQIAGRFAGQTPDPISAEQFAREVWEEAVKEILGLENVRPKTMERPAFNAALEVNRTFNAKAWAPRLRLGIGVWKVTLGASFAVAFGDDVYPKTPVYVGLEIVTHFLVSDNPRASVVDVFVRADVETRNRDTNADAFILGARYLLDVL